MSNNKEKLSFYGVFIFIIGSLFYCYEYFIQVAPSVLTNNLMRDFHIDAYGFGIMAAMFFYTYAFFQIPAGALLDRFGARKILTTVAFLCGFGALIFALAPNIYVASFARLLMGLASSFAFISVLYLIIRWLPSCHFALFAGLLQLIASIGAIAGQGPFASWATSFGWRQTMIFLAFIGFSIAIINYFLLRDKPKNFIEQKKTHSSMIANLRTILTKKQTWYIAIYSFCVWSAMTVFAALWGVAYLKTNYHLLNASAARVIAFAWIGAAIGSTATGWISDSIGRRILPLVILAIVGTISTSLIIFVPKLSITELYLVLFLIGFSTGGQTLIFAVVKEINPIAVTGTANGLNNMAVLLSGALLQPLVGKLLDINWNGILQNRIRVYDIHAYHMAFLVLPICYLVATVVSMFFLKETFCINMSDKR